MRDVLVDQVVDPDRVAAFKAALRKGTGRAMLILRSDPDSEALRKELLNACLNNQVYDQQCEISRAPYLVRLIQEIGWGRIVWSALVDALSLVAREYDERDRIQMFEVLCSLASHDPSFDRTELERIMVNSDFHDFTSCCMEGFVQLKGIAGILFCLRHFGWALEKDEFNGGWPFEYLKTTLIERDGPEAAMRELAQACVDHPDLDQTIRQLYFKLETTKQEFRPFSREDVAARVRKKESIPFDWIETASRDDLGWAADQLCEADTVWETQQYLRVFMRRPFPRPVQSLFKLIGSENRRLASSAMRVLGRICDPAVRELAFRFASDPESSEGFILLLRKNFIAGDFATITPLLVAAARDENEYHGFGGGIINLIDEIPEVPEESREALLHLHEHGPCSTCRETVALHLTALGNIPRWIIDEWPFDCVPEIAKLGAAGTGTITS